MNCENKTKNMQNCNCTYSCSKKGTCCECLHYHRSMRQLPACFFPNDAEKTYDRSYKHFVELFQQGRL
ncbi:MAG: cytosolic protein [Candidatus Cloacimonas sp. 4484_143]|nr:MAG: cytosolic protein [Candidatus Cloacimonas sp. 4484_143]RLC51887.1 MAG: cytosolic protein [Candidatus Cloacimonadota bacterium]RLC53443.1 MAG: cytosolic protein [Candidatus Cloacimonadota bacterium]